MVVAMVEKDEKSLRLSMQVCTQTEFFFIKLSLQLKDTIERMKVVDAVATLVEKMMKQGLPFAKTIQNGGVSIILRNQVLQYTLHFTFQCKDIYQSSLNLAMS
jgi:hypothetical protein